jgi:hypothetical protein
MREIVATLPPDEATANLVDLALENGSTDNVTALIAWMAPVSALEPVVAEQLEPVRASLLVPFLAGLALVIVILVIIVIYLVA